MEVILLSIVVSVAVATVVTLALRRKDRREIQALLDRLTELEAARGEEALNGNGEASTGTTVEAGPGSGERVSGELSADVLAGRTTYVQRLVDGAGGGRISLADQAILRVHECLEDSVSPAMLAERLHVSLRTLERGLAVALECTPRQLIVAMKMREARRLLESGGLNVSEVATRLGFSSPAHFSRRFRAFYKVTPSELGARATRKVA